MYRRLRKKVKSRIVHNHSQLLRFEIPISACVHFSGIRFGHKLEHPFERYLINLQNDVPLLEARCQFIHFLRHYRPRHMGEAQGLELSRLYPLWLYPWQKFHPSLFDLEKGWRSTPDSSPDIMTHFSEAGIASYRIDEQFYWLERAYRAIRDEGYQPEKYGDYVRVRRFCRMDGTSAYLLLDGNHRVSAMAVLGMNTLLVEQEARDIVLEQEAENWYGVEYGFYTVRDAQQMFDVYFRGNRKFCTTQVAAPIVGPRGWLALYSLD